MLTLRMLLEEQFAGYSADTTGTSNDEYITTRVHGQTNTTVTHTDLQMHASTVEQMFSEWLWRT